VVGDLVFVKTESFMSAGSHHMFVMQDAQVTADRPLYTCSGLDFKPLVHSAQTPQQITSYPAGIGVRLGAGMGFQVLAHYFNTSTTAVTAEVSIALHVANPGEVQQYAASLFGNVALINIPTGPNRTVSGSCTLPRDANVLSMVSHMHQFGTNFVATAGGQQLYQTTEWEEPPPRVFDPPLLLPSGTRIQYTCTYNNTSGGTLTFGESAKTNEMCIFSGTYFPAPNGQPISCLTGF
jgi:hypothetical protein